VAAAAFFSAIASYSPSFSSLIKLLFGAVSPEVAAFLPALVAVAEEGMFRLLLEPLSLLPVSTNDIPGALLVLVPCFRMVVSLSPYISPLELVRNPFFIAGPFELVLAAGPVAGD
jgi:hypothetical protein